MVSIFIDYQPFHDYNIFLFALLISKSMNEIKRRVCLINIARKYYGGNHSYFDKIK